MIYQPITDIDLTTDYPTFDIFVKIEIDLPDNIEVRYLINQVQREIAAAAYGSR